MPKMGFNIEVTVKNPEVLAEVQERFKRMQVVYNNIIDEWARGNEGKFSKSKGQESSGIALDVDVFWEPLTQSLKTLSHETKRAHFSGLQTTTAYERYKRRQGWPNWLMVATGNLKRALTTNQGFQRDVSNTEAVVGMPFAVENQDKVIGNWNRRPTIFLDRSDTLMIRNELKNWLTIGEDYKEVLFAKGLEKVARPKWEAEFLNWQGI